MSSMGSDTRASRLALLGNPNCGKSVLFNRLTGARQKVANFAGVTVDVKSGYLKGAGTRPLEIVDLPGTYSLHPSSEDERVACSAILDTTTPPDLVALVVDATRLRRGLRLAAALRHRGVPMVVLVTMLDKAARNGVSVDLRRLEEAIGVPVIAATGIEAQGVEALRRFLSGPEIWSGKGWSPDEDRRSSGDAVCEDDATAREWCHAAGMDVSVRGHRLTRLIDRWVLDPWVGGVLLIVVLFLIFQAVFSWAEWPMQQIEGATTVASEWIGAVLPDGLLKSLLINGVVAGVGGVIVFLPQILILFFFILVLEESGYLPRAALLLDRLMISVGLSGRSFIPLLSSFACAIPGVMAARTISDPRSRWITIAIAPLMTCSARLPVYALLIGAFIPQREVWMMNLQGLVLFGLYLLGMLSAVVIAWLSKKWLGQGKNPDLMIELPDYHVPRASAIALGLWYRGWIFIKSVGGIILALSIILWALSSFPAAPENATLAPIQYSVAGIVGHWLAVFFAPIGFNWQISLALIPGLAAREVVVSSLGTVYALSNVGDDVGEALLPLIAGQWSFATGISLLIWFVYAPQCLASLAVIRKEVGNWQLPAFITVYLFGLAYLASWVAYTVCQEFNL